MSARAAVTDFVVGIARCNETDDVFGKTLASIASSSRLPSSVIIVDNGDVALAKPDLPVQVVLLRPDHNMGCAGSWNFLLWSAYVQGVVPIIINADTAVAKDTFAKMLAVPSPAVVLAYGFGCFRLDEGIYTQIGGFDEEFHPVYCEDVDYRRRLKLAGIPAVEWPIFPALEIGPGRVRSPVGIEHGKHDEAGYQGWTADKAAWFADRLEANKARYVRKWGGTPYEETYTSPFDGQGAD
jgi:hypothetical protein